jgi:CBS domain-containing protein
MYTTATVKQVLDRKGHQVLSISPDATIFEALKYMAEKNVGALMVIENDQLVGIFSERDYARKVVLEGGDEKTTLVKQVMTSQVIGITLDRRVDECLALMTNKFIRHLPVIDQDGVIAGVISIGDIVKEVIAEQGFVIDQLVNYITGEKAKPPVPEPNSFDLE